MFDRSGHTVDIIVAQIDLKKCLTHVVVPEAIPEG
jgi:hypothetical protein